MNIDPHIQYQLDASCVYLVSQMLLENEYGIAMISMYCLESLLLASIREYLVIISTFPEDEITAQVTVSV